MSEKISIELSYNEALVLFEFLSNYSNDEKLEIQHKAEERVLWDLLCQLETKLTNPLSSEYHLLLQSARDILLKK